MRYLKYLALLAICMLPAAIPSQAQIAVGVRVGPGYDYVAPVCSYGYYGYSPYACAPYGYYGPEWFTGGVFIGAGPWFHGFRGRAGFYGRGSYGRGFYGRPGFAGRERFSERGDFGRRDFGRRDFERRGSEHRDSGRGDFGHRDSQRGDSGRGDFHGGGGFHGGGRR